MIKIICFGKLKEDYLINAVNDYYERVPIIFLSRQGTPN